MRQTMETVPRDGTAVILENDALGNFELARWSVNDGAWLSDKGERCRIVPTCWHPMQRSSSQTDGRTSSAASGPAACAMAITGAQATASRAPEKPVRVVKDAEVDAHACSPSARSEWRRFAGVSVGIVMVLMSALGVFHRSEVASLANRLVTLSSQASQENLLPPPHVEDYRSSLNAAQQSIADLAALLAQERARVASLEVELKKTRRELVFQAVQVIEKGDEARQAASIVAELQQALARETAKVSALQTDAEKITGRN